MADVDDDEQELPYEIVPAWNWQKSPSLIPAKARLAHAVVRMNDVAALVDTMVQAAASNPVRITVDRKLVDAGLAAPNTLTWTKDAYSLELLDTLRAVTGESVFHLRTTLEYLAYQVVWLDRGNPYRQTAFPICAHKNDWPDALKKLPKMHSWHADRFKAVQPFAGCTWSGLLSALSNQDKHRAVISLRYNVGAAMKVKPGIPLIDDPSDPDNYLVSTVSPPLELRFEDSQRLVVPTLIEMASAIATLLNDFSTAFGEPADLVVATPQAQ